MLRTFGADRRGQFAMMFAVAAPTMLLGVGLAIDFAILSDAQSKLQGSLDSALLAASRLKDSNDKRQSTFDAYLAANLANDPLIVSYAAKLSVNPRFNSIETRGTLQAEVGLFIMPALTSVDGKVSVQATAYEATDAIEVAMVLDNTGSMGAAGMTALREAATELANILEDAGSVNREVRAALVPFVTAVNVKGTGYQESWVDSKAKAPLHGANFLAKSDGTPYNHLDLFKALNVDWKGCVEARPSPHNLDDSEPNPSRPETLFVPYLAPDNPGKAATSPNSGTAWNNSYLTDSFTSRNDQRTVARYLSTSTGRVINEKGPRTTGPNYACPTPIEPLNADFDVLRTAIGKMIHWEGSGTNVAEGLAWGMRVLSPEEPYSQGVAFNSEGHSKALVVFTDGENNVFGASSQTYNTSDYGAYSFADAGRMGSTNRGSALTNVNTWTQTMCTRLKDKGVHVYTVLLGADTQANRTLYSKCATTPADYFPTKNISELKPIFQKIGSRIAKLYLTN